MAKKEISFNTIVIFIAVSFAIAIFWDSFPLIKNTVHSILTPSFGALLNWNVTYGMLIISFLIAFIIMIYYPLHGKKLENLKDKLEIIHKKKARR